MRYEGEEWLKPLKSLTQIGGGATSYDAIRKRPRRKGTIVQGRQAGLRPPPSRVEAPALVDALATDQVSEGEDDEAENLFRELDQEELDVRDVKAVRSPSACAAPTLPESIQPSGHVNKGENL